MAVAVELLALVIAGLIVTLAVLGRAAGWFAGTELTGSLLPFAGTVLTLVLAGAAMLKLWLQLRRRLAGRAASLPAAAALSVVVVIFVLAQQQGFDRDLARLRTLMGGTEEAARVGVAHQVYAAYRRADPVQLQRILERSRSYLPVIRQAAAANGIEHEILVGVAATESSFLPRDSKDGGRGLFQITAPPQTALVAAASQLGIDRPDVRNPAHNAHIAAATLRHYLHEMKGDLFLGLLAYNIGPRNGGLRSIMEQYGARDFFTIKPYLQALPGDYPIRVLTAALAYRLLRADGKLPRYEEGDNARRIQQIGIPGLDTPGSGWISSWTSSR